MLTFRPDREPSAPLRVLAVGAHSDDIEIGAGGTILRLVRERPGLVVRWAVFCSTPQREREARDSAADFLAGCPRAEVEVFDFQDAFLPTRLADVKRRFETFKDFAPDLIFTHCRHDLHQDHRVLCELAWNTFRDHAILEYEIPKYDGDLASPSAFVPLSEGIASRKVELLIKHFGTQRAKHWFDEELFKGLMRLRGVECRSPSRYAEGFYGRKLTLGL